MDYNDRGDDEGRYYDPDELTSFHCTAHDALNTLSRHKGYACAPHWLCCSREAKATGVGFVYGDFLARGIAYDRIKPLIEESLAASPKFIAWREREIKMAEARGERAWIESDGD